MFRKYMSPDDDMMALSSFLSGVISAAMNLRLAG